MTELKLNTEYTYTMFGPSYLDYPCGIQFTFKITQIDIKSKIITMVISKCINYTANRPPSTTKHIGEIKQLTINNTEIFNIYKTVSAEPKWFDGTDVTDGTNYATGTYQIPYNTDAPTMNFEYYSSNGGSSSIDTQAISNSDLYINGVNQTKLYVNLQPIKVLYVNNNAVYYNENNS